MSDTPTDEQPTETPAEETPSDAPTDEPTDPPADPAEGDGEGTPPEGEQDSGLTREDALSALRDTRREAASWRTKFRDLEAQFAEAKTPEEYEAAVEAVRQEAAAEARASLVENVALKHNLPSELAALLQGDDRDALDAHAKQLSKFVQAPSANDPDLQGGLGGDADEGDDLTVEQARLAARKRRGR